MTFVFAVQITLFYVFSIKVILITFLAIMAGRAMNKIYWRNIQISPCTPPPTHCL